MDSTSADACYYLALGYSRLGESQLELSQYELALTRNPSHLESLLNLGTRNLEQRNFVAAAELFGRALRTDPTQTRAWRGMGIVMYAQGNTDQAIRSFRSAIALDPGDEKSIRYLDMIGRRD